MPPSIFVHAASAPTARLQLHRLIQKVRLGSGKEAEPFSAFLGGLARTQAEGPRQFARCVIAAGMVQ